MLERLVTRVHGPVGEEEAALRPGEEVGDHLEHLPVDRGVQVLLLEQDEADGHLAELRARVLRVLAPEQLLDLVGRE